MRAVLWLALALAGQAAALRLIDAGPLIHYQHYVLPFTALQDAKLRWALFVVITQAVFVLGGIAARRASIREWLQRLGSPWRTAGAAALALCVAAAVSRDQIFFVFEVCFAAALQLVNIGNIVLAAWALPEGWLSAAGKRLDAWLGSKESAPRQVRLDGFVWLAAAWVTIVSALLAWFVYERHPHVADEVVYLYNARYFAAGEVFMPPPPLPAAFEVDLMDYKPDKWFSAVPVGWPAILSVGERLRAGWLVNPVLGGLNILLIYLLLRHLYSARVSRISVLLLCASPWYVFLAMSYMNHIALLTCALVAFWGASQTIRSDVPWWASIAGLGVGAASLIRPLDGAIIAVLTVAWLLCVKGWRPKLWALAALGIGTIAAGALAMPYNKILTGDATESPLSAYVDRVYGPKAGAYGFGPERGLGWPTDPYPGHTPFEAVILAELNGHSLNTELFGWSTGSLCLIAIFIFFGRWRKPDGLMLAVIAGVLLAYAPYWGNGGPDFGARYWFLILVPCLALSARGLELLEAGLKSPARTDARATLAVAALCALALVNYFPWRSVDKYHNYLRMRADVRELAAEHHFGKSLVLIRGDRFPDYMSAAIYNPLDLRADAPIYVWDRNEEVRSKVLSLYPDRPVWVLEGPTVTHAGYRIAAGPLTAEAKP
jgi:hypothetical protein